MSSESLQNKTGASINKKNLDSSISLPTTGFPLTNIDINDVAATKLTGGVDQNIVQNNGGNITVQDLIIATKQVDNTVVPLDGWVLTYDNASGKVKFKAASSSAMSQVQFLASQAALGNLIFANGNRTSSGTVCSYVPANGKTFTLVSADAMYQNANTNGAMTATLKNNGTTRSQLIWNDSAVNIAEPQQFFEAMGDQLAGDGTKTYIINQDSTNGTNGIYGNIQGYIA